jgi:predicted AAA+ superfamily ATPase
MDIIGFCNGEQVNFSSVARDTGVSSKTVHEYFQILSDTLVGSLLEPFSQKDSRNIITMVPKFYLFDVGLALYLNKIRIEEERGADFGRAFEHFIFMELRAHRSYTDAEYPISYWRTTNGFEVDFVLDAGRVAIEVKSASNLTGTDLKGLFRFAKDYRPEKAIVVTNEQSRRKIGPVDLVPWRDFLNDLWAGKIIG